ncbi:hypothetical protein E6C27_scaffold43059G00070 [Cucumis melo var. makuwa]|uniref:NBS-LRR type resistance protein n=1 Tax=Cucumis melo var. makuwa TaxID=1194695 RepID=A0A5A7SXD8_CUCMM|nr:hypothetical protein E6C27_scaffold43059G00070 [Cucumis melo var. makuwa]
MHTSISLVIPSDAHISLAIPKDAHISLVIPKDTHISLVIRKDAHISREIPKDTMPVRYATPWIKLTVTPQSILNHLQQSHHNNVQINGSVISLVSQTV